MANQTNQLAELLRRDGLEVNVVRVNPPYRPAWVSRLRGLRGLFRLPPFLLALWRAFGRCDVVHLMASSGGAWHLQAAPAILVARLRGAPVLVNYRGGGAEAFLRRHARLVRPVMALAGVLAVPSGFLQQVFARFGMKAEILPNIVDLARFAPGPQLLPADAPHLIVTRNLEAIYDNATALSALALVREKFPTARMTIAGEGSLQSELQALAHRLGLVEAVVFSGRIDNTRIPALYRSASVFINPSRVDNMPNSVLEALASGVPVVSTDVGGVPHVVEHGRTALLVPPGDSRAMAAAVISLLLDPQLRGRLVAAGRNAARRYEWTQVRPQLLSLYERLAPTAAGASTRIV
jgi:glycosyltransferase involved in cell wall biosynthesis